MDYRKAIVDFLLVRQGGECAACGQAFSEIAPPEIDHVYPKAKGGEDSLHNFQLLHHVCNLKKSAKTEEQRYFQKRFKKEKKLIEKVILSGQLAPSVAAHYGVSIRTAYRYLANARKAA